MNCVNCGAHVSPSVTFCTECGTPVDEQPAPSPRTVPAPPPPASDPDLDDHFFSDTSALRKGGGGRPIAPSRPAPAYSDDGVDYAARAQANQWATYALVLGIASFFCTFFTAIPGVILGIISLKNADTGGRVRAVIGLAIRGFSLLLNLVFLVLSAINA